MSAYTLSQLLVLLAIVSDAISFQFRDRKKILLCLFVSVALTAIHFFLLKQPTAALLMLLAAGRYLAGVHSTSRRTMGAFIGLCIATTALTYNGLLSILSCTGSVIHTAGAFCRDDRHLRLTMIVGTLFWIAHNILAKTPGGVVLESLFLCSNLAGYYRHYIRHKRSPGSV
ncbi:MAG: YgjV family protein [Desulfovibrio sp.]